jgi:hypothetical protein
VLGGLKVAPTVFAPKDGDLLLHALGDVHLGADAVYAHVGGIWVDARAAHTAQAADDVKEGVRRTRECIHACVHGLLHKQ